MNRMRSPYQVYLDKIEAGELQRDEEQHAAMQALDGLFLRLRKEEPVEEESILGKALKRIGGGPALKGLYMYGGTGRGKSMLMDMFYECLDTPKKRRVHFHEFMDEVHAKLHIFRQSGAEGGAGVGQDPLKPLAKGISKEAWILCFDEFHVTDIADAAIMSRLFTHLFKRGVIMVATSNWAPDELYKNGLQRELFMPFIEVLKDACDVMPLGDGTDYRFEVETTFDRYIVPVSKPHSKLLEDMFAELAITGKGKGKKATLTNKGRKIDIKKAAPTPEGDKIGLSTFDDLCRATLGASDYLKIAKTYSTLFLDGIPALGPEDRNEAKRFTNLIDALYENKVLFICTAEVEPELIYPHGDHAFEFERTVSRLEEMQSTDWPPAK